MKITEAGNIGANILEIEKAFTLWDEEYRANPEKFMSMVEHLLGNTPETYGVLARACFIEFLRRGALTIENQEPTAVQLLWHAHNICWCEGDKKIANEIAATIAQNFAGAA